ncbi:MAG: hypothetical protein A2520_06460 [Deltaproteobacteria bacterium RIFOXYD12_FULL_53_23]|nr:MAG: hypothetical protein A2520_06460 [Deltaproteobacteria bacterium RIFOXYD12_FULL_53_23]
MRVLFIRHHPNAADKDGRYPAAQYPLIPIGLAYIAAYLQQHDIPVRILDSYVGTDSIDSFQRAIQAMPADLIGITATSNGIQGAMEAAEIIKQCWPDTPIVIGGPHMATYPEKTLLNSHFDFGVVGEGEQTILELVDALKHGTETRGIPGLLTKAKKQVSQLTPRKRVNNLDKFPHPARELFPNSRYKTLLGFNPVTYILTSRGCPFQCTFCDHGLWGRETTFHSPEWIIDEIQHCLAQGAREIYIYDETFSLNKERAKTICKLIIEKNIKFSWVVSSRVDTVDRELIELLKQAGCRQIRFGVESGLDKNLQTIGKNITIKKVRHTFDLCDQVGIDTYAYFMIGLPSETLQDMEETINFAIQLNPGWTNFNILTMKPGTKVYRQAAQQGHLPPNLWEGLLDGTVSEEDCFWPTPGVTKTDLLSMKKKAHIQFYLRAGFIKKRLHELFTTNRYRLYLSVIRSMLGNFFTRAEKS